MKRQTYDIYDAESFALSSYLKPDDVVSYYHNSGLRWQYKSLPVAGTFSDAKSAMESIGFQILPTGVKPMARSGYNHWEYNYSEEVTYYPVCSIAKRRIEYEVEFNNDITTLKAGGR